MRVNSCSKVHLLGNPFVGIFLVSPCCYFLSNFSQHKGDIVNARSKPVAEHFNLPGHGLKDVIFIGIEKVLPSTDTFLRKERESFYIRRGNTVHNGANRRF